MSGEIPHIQYPADDGLRQFDLYGEFHCRPYARSEDVRRQFGVAKALGSECRRRAAQLSESLKEGNPLHQ